MRYMNLTSLLIILLFQLKWVTLKMVFNHNKCGSKLLDDMQMVPDSAFSASSFFKHNNEADKKMDLSPKAARESYDKDNQEFAWCPMNKVSSDLQEYLEIDMGRLIVINFAQTRGRFAQGAGKEFIPYYKLKYRREGTEKWRQYKKFDPLRGLTEILKGPSDPFLDAYETLDPPIIARWIRIYPFSYTLMRVCMKVQLFGCTFESNVLEYRIPQGSEATPFFISLPGIMSTVMKIFQDSSYDGSSDRGLLYGGLGRLTDNKTGGNLILNPTKAQYFVGWKIKYIMSSEDQTLTLWFRFDSVRNFSRVKLNGYENATMKIAQPEKFEAKFSIQGEVFNDADTILSNFPESKSSDISKLESPWVQFDLHHKIGQFLQLKLYFQSDWIILTEIEFSSEKVIGFQSEKENTDATNQRTNTESPIIPDNPQSHITSNAVVDIVYILTILLCVLVGIIVAISIFWLIMRHRRIKRKKDIKKSELALFSQNPFKTLSPPSNTQTGVHRGANSYIGKYAQGSLQLAPRISISSQPDPCLFKHNIPRQNCQTNENNIYTSIPGSDNDSSLSTDYMASSGVNSNHPYTQTMPATCSMSDYILNQPQIIGNPLADFLESQQHFGRSTNTGICSYDPELLGITSHNHINSIQNTQSFPGAPICYQPIEYSEPTTIDKSFYPISNPYQVSPLKNNHLLKS